MASARNQQIKQSEDPRIRVLKEGHRKYESFVPNLQPQFRTITDGKKPFRETGRKLNDPYKRLQAHKDAVELSNTVSEKLKDPRFPSRIYAPLSNLLKAFRRYCNGGQPKTQKVSYQVGDGRTCTVEEAVPDSHVVSPETFLWTAQGWLNRAAKIQHRKDREDFKAKELLDSAKARFSEVVQALKSGALREADRERAQAYLTMFNNHLKGQKTASRPTKVAHLTIAPEDFLECTRNLVVPKSVPSKRQKVAA